MSSLRLLASFFVLTACGGTTGFQQSTARDAVSAPPEINESEVAAAFALRPQLPKPYRVGVFFRPNASSADEPQWRWDPEHKRAVLGIAKALRASGELGDVFAIDEGTAASDDLRAIRIAAARHGADAVLVVSGGDEVRESLNGWAASYAALLPMLFAPGSELEVRFTTHAELWDVRNEYLYLSARAEEEAHQQRALCWLDSEAAIEQAQAASVKLLVGELEQRFAGLHAVAKR
jgi:hypothetical protein